MEFSINRRLGLHLRVQTSILQLLERAEQLQLPFFQCFFVRQETGTLIGVSAQDITIVLENTCHGKLAVGSDILDFKVLLEKINKPERIGFCIDTAHAYSFGYDIADDQMQDDFIRLLESTIGIERIKLIHLNDL